MKRSAAGLVLLSSLGLGAAPWWGGGSQDDVEKELARVLADPTRYSVEVIQREHQRYPGSSPVYRILRDEKPVAVLKCNSTAGTFVRAAHATYELSRALGLETYSVTVLATPESLSSLRQASGGVFDYPKDDCALKEFHVGGRYYWREQKGQHFYRDLDPEKWTLRNALRCDLPLPDDAKSRKSFHIEGDGPSDPPSGKRRQFRSPTKLVRAAKDFSSLMLMDAIVGNGDRFIAGENLHFRSQKGDDPEKEGDHWVFDDVRFLSADNGTTFKKSHRPKRLLAFVTRFDRKFVERVRELADRLERAKQDKSVLERHYPYLDVTMRSGQYAPDYLAGNVAQVLDHVRQAEERCGEETWFP